jgi:hypothetical protein
MVAEGMSAELALKYVQMKHPPAWPNDGFRYQLKLFEGSPCTQRSSLCLTPGLQSGRA